MLGFLQNVGTRVKMVNLKEGARLAHGNRCDTCPISLKSSRVARPARHLLFQQLLVWGFP